MTCRVDQLSKEPSTATLLPPWLPARGGLLRWRSDDLPARSAASPGARLRTATGALPRGARARQAAQTGARAAEAACKLGALSH
jgi:hypothetical protein